MVPSKIHREVGGLTQTGLHMKLLQRSTGAAHILVSSVITLLLINT